MKKLYISPYGQKVSLKSLAQKNKFTVNYRYEKLPSKLKPWYKYAIDFVNVFRQKTPNIIYANDQQECYMMEKEPFSNIEIEFLDKSLNPKTPSPPTIFQVKVIAQIGSETMELIYKDKVISSKTQSFIINPYQNFDDLDEQQQYYVEEVEICRIMH
eukprot:403375608